MTTAPDIEAIRAAAARIAGMVRRTPVLDVAPVRGPLPGDVRLTLKLECLQVTGSFKARGASNRLKATPHDQLARGLVTASGGNHGLGVAYAGRQAGVPVTIFLPSSTPQAKADKLRDWGAAVTIEGTVWDEANRAALAAAERDGLTYVHPFADPLVIAGQGTCGLEMAEQVPDADVALVAIGGGGLISGVAIALKALKPSIRVIGVEPVGAPTLKESVAAGRAIELAEIRTAAGTLAPRRSDPLNVDIVTRHVDEIVLVDDDDMRRAARWLWAEFGVAAELSGAASVAALLSGAWQPRDGERVLGLVCGAGTDGIG